MRVVVLFALFLLGESVLAGEDTKVPLTHCTFHGMSGRCADFIPGWTVSSRRTQPQEPQTEEERTRRKAEEMYVELWQKPRSHYVRGLSAKPWHSADELGFGKLLEDRHEEILKELLELMGQQKYGRRFAIDGQALSEFNLWKLYHFTFNGRKCTENFECCPITVDTLRQIDSMTNGLFNNTVGLTTFSIMEPSTHIKRHHGPNNLRIRCHLGLVTPKGAFLRVGGEMHEWEKGKTFCFDDSFDHEAWNNATTPRAILMFDIWHYDFTAVQVQALVKAFPATKTAGCASMSGMRFSVPAQASSQNLFYLLLGLPILFCVWLVFTRRQRLVVPKRHV
jgi:hypothetical protein